MAESYYKGTGAGPMNWNRFKSDTCLFVANEFQRMQLVPGGVTLGIRIPSYLSRGRGLELPRAIFSCHGRLPGVNSMRSKLVLT